tara:strand:+ start:2115 stop:4160 length:2046 start_codon:yes stop_codon:yes gene_type:complete
MTKTSVFSGSSELDLGGEAAQENIADDNTVGGFSFSEPQNSCDFVPTSAKETLKSLGISKSSTIGGITVIPEHGSIVQGDCRDRSFNRYCWFAAVDEKGSTAFILKKLLYCLHHVQKYYLDVQKPLDKRAPFEPQNCTGKDANVTYRGGMSYHYVTDDEEVVSVPIFKITMFIDVASTGGFSAMTQAYQFIVLETPVTFDLVECIYRSCKYIKDGESAKVTEVLRSYWCDIASHMSSMDGNTHNVRAENMMSVSFEDLFNDVSRYCIWRLFRIARCIASARRHMHLIATQHRTQHCNEIWKDASNKIEVRFETIDAHILGRVNSYDYDKLWCKVSDQSANVWYSSLDKYKVIVEKHKKKKKPKGPSNGDENDQALAEAEEDLPPPPWENPRKFDVPTVINFSHQQTRTTLSAFISEEYLDMDAIEEFVVGSSPDNFGMGGFPPSFMCASVELSLFKPSTNKYVMWDSWSMANQCNLPAQMRLSILVGKGDSGDGDSQVDQMDLGGNSIAENDLPRDCFSMEDYRQFLKTTASRDLTRPLKGRCLEIYLMAWNGARKLKNPVARVKYIYDRYFRNTVLPLVEVNIKSDENGEMGGSDPRLAICSEMASMSCVGGAESYRCRSVFKFREGLKNILLNSTGSVDIIKRFRGSLASAEGCLYLMHEIPNLNGNVAASRLCLCLLG